MEQIEIATYMGALNLIMEDFKGEISPEQLQRVALMLAKINPDDYEISAEDVLEHILTKFGV